MESSWSSTGNNTASGGMMASQERQKEQPSDAVGPTRAAHEAEEQFQTALTLVRARIRELRVAFGNDLVLLDSIMVQMNAYGALGLSRDEFLGTLELSKHLRDPVTLDDGATKRTITGGELQEVLLDKMSRAFTDLATAARSSSALPPTQNSSTADVQIRPTTLAKSAMVNGGLAGGQRSPHQDVKIVKASDIDLEEGEVVSDISPAMPIPQSKQLEIHLVVPDAKAAAQLEGMPLWEVNLVLHEALSRGPVAPDKPELDSWVVATKHLPRGGVTIRTDKESDYDSLRAHTQWLFRFRDCLNGRVMNHIVIMRTVPLTGMGDLKIPLVKEAVVQLLYDLNHGRLVSLTRIQMIKDIYWNSDRTNTLLLRNGSISVEFNHAVVARECAEKGILWDHQIRQCSYVAAVKPRTQSGSAPSQLKQLPAPPRPQGPPQIVPKPLNHILSTGLSPNSLPSGQCERCQGRDHRAGGCKKQWRCVHCAGPHRSWKCNAGTNFNCGLCGGPHQWGAPGCPIITNALEASCERVNGTPLTSSTCVPTNIVHPSRLAQMMSGVDSQVAEEPQEPVFDASLGPKASRANLIPLPNPRVRSRPQHEPYSRVSVKGEPTESTIGRLSSYRPQEDTLGPQPGRIAQLRQERKSSAPSNDGFSDGSRPSSSLQAPSDPKNMGGTGGLIPTTQVPSAPKAMLQPISIPLPAKPVFIQPEEPPVLRDTGATSTSNDLSPSVPTNLEDQVAAFVKQEAASSRPISVMSQPDTRSQSIVFGQPSLPSSLSQRAILGAMSDQINRTLEKTRPASSPPRESEPWTSVSQGSSTATNPSIDGPSSSTLVKPFSSLREDLQTLKAKAERHFGSSPLSGNAQSPAIIRPPDHKRQYDEIEAFSGSDSASAWGKENVDTKKMKMQEEAARDDDPPII